MAQSFSLRLPLIDGQGNFGSLDGDSAAAMRYTESRMAKVAHSLLDDIDKNTVDFQENYDGSEQEPKVLPARFPNILVNGAGGIAVGMATNIPPHNLGELIDACCAYIDNSEISLEELMTFVHGPDFPTAGIIIGKSGIRKALMTGRGSITIRGRAVIESLRENRQVIIISEIPYQVNKAKMVERIAELVKEKRIEGISDLRDESDKAGVRVVIELKKDAMAEVILNQLYSYSPLQVSFGINMLALNNQRPQVMNLHDVIVAFVNFREEVVTRRTKFLLTKARSRAHILIGLAIAVANIDEVIALIKAAPDPATAKDRLLAKAWKAENVESLIKLVNDNNNQLLDGSCYFTEEQAKAILEMRLARLTGLEHEKINQELQSLAQEIIDFLEILESRTRLLEVLKEELIEVRTQFATPRKSVIEASELEYDIEDLIPQEDMVVTVTIGGYIKRVPLSTYRAQKRGGKGRSGITMHEEDAITDLFVTNTHVPLMFFSNFGQVYKLKVYKLPLGTPQAKGRALVNIFPLKLGEKITTMMPLPEDETLWQNLNIMFATANGNVRRNDLSDFHNIPSNGKIAIRLDEHDLLIGVNLCKEEDHILLASKNGKSMRFPITAVRVFKSRTSDGVRGMKLALDDKVISMSVLTGVKETSENRDTYLKIPLEKRLELAKLNDVSLAGDILAGIDLAELSDEMIVNMAKAEQFIFTITQNGYGKRTSAYEYRVTNRGGQGITNIVTSTRNGCVINSFAVQPDDQVMVMSNKGTLIRCPVQDIRIAGRITQGVTIFKITKEEVVVSVAHIAGSAVNEDIINEPQELE
jgi:DNA gyrase subunit A